MSEKLTPTGYTQTKRKLAGLERRLKSMEDRSDLNPQHLAGVIRSYRRMIEQYAAELQIYEAGESID